MFLKNVNKNFFNLSIRGNLTLLYSLSTFFLLSFICLLSFIEMKDIIQQKNIKSMMHNINIIQNILLQNSSDKNRLKKEIEEAPILLENSESPYFVKLVKLNSNINFTTPGINSILNDSSFLKILPLDNKLEYENWSSKNKNKYLLLKKIILIKKKFNVQEKWFIEIALDTTYEYVRLLEYIRQLIIILILGIIIAFGLGFIIAKKGMKKLSELTDTAKKISFLSLNQRIHPQDWPKELRKLGVAFNEMLNRLECAFTRLNQFSSDLAHELRTPVNNLMGEIEISLSHNSSQGEYKQVLESNIEEVRRISQIIENILFLAKTENPKFDLKKENVNIQKEIMVVLDYYESLAEEKNVEIVYTGQGHASVNSVMFRRMVSNLLSNALKYTQPNKKIYIQIEELKNNFIQLRIKDEGVGISKQELPKIFDRFYRVDHSRAQLSGGVGLGLSIVKSILELHHAKLKVFSVLNSGTTFEIQIPK